MNQPLYRLDRRGFLRMGAAGVVGATVPTNAYSDDDSSSSRLGKGAAKSVLIVMLSGGPSQLDTLDPKPESPTEVRGEFSPISTSIPGIVVCHEVVPIWIESSLATTFPISHPLLDTFDLATMEFQTECLCRII